MLLLCTYVYEILQSKKWQVLYFLSTYLHIFISKETLPVLCSFIPSCYAAFRNGNFSRV